MNSNVLAAIRILAPDLDERAILSVARAAQDAMTAFGIESVSAIAVFLAECAHESAAFTASRENLNYSARGLARTWGRFSVTGRPGGAPNALAVELERDPEAIANHVYANRMGNCDDNSGDGWAYRGGGWLQLTGRSMYRAAGQAMGIDLESRPELIERQDICARASAWCFVEHMNLLDYAEDGKIDTVSNIINTGSASRTAIGQAERRALYVAAMRELAS